MQASLRARRGSRDAPGRCAVPLRGIRVRGAVRVLLPCRVNESGSLAKPCFPKGLGHPHGPKVMRIGCGGLRAEPKMQTGRTRLSSCSRMPAARSLETGSRRCPSVELRIPALSRHGVPMPRPAERPKGAKRKRSEEGNATPRRDSADSVRSFQGVIAEPAPGMPSPRGQAEPQGPRHQSRPVARTRRTARVRRGVTGPPDDGKCCEAAGTWEGAEAREHGETP
jgi:hypothetical protein